jgi:Uncharacterized protein conserved in bacteria
MDALKLAQLMCSRLCHDLITPVGALSSGLEILHENLDNLDAELMDLTMQSAQNAAQRLMYYRAAFGFSGLNLFKTPPKVQELLAGYLKAAKITLDWSCAYPEALHEIFQERTRILLNVAGIMAECAPYGGTFHITITPTDSNQDLVYDFDLQGDLVALKSNNHLALRGELPEDTITPHNVQSYLTALFLDQKEAVLSLETSTPGHLRGRIVGVSVTAQKMGTLF